VQDFLGERLGIGVRWKSNILAVDGVLRNDDRSKANNISENALCLIERRRGL